LLAAMQPGQAAPAAGGYGELALTALLLVVAVCVVVLVLARYAGRWLAARGGGDEGLVRVRARVPLEPRRALYVIEVGGRTLLVGSSEGGISVLSEVEAAALPRSEPRGFAALVAQALARRGRAGRVGGDDAGGRPAGPAAS
jgi:flagellar protein FliO/FliZ